MSTICCLNMPTNHPSLTTSLFHSNSNNKRVEQEKDVEMEEENYSIILNQHSPSITHSNHLPMSTRCLQQQHHQQQQSPQPLFLVNEEAELLNVENAHDNDKLLLPSSTRSLKRRMSLFEKSRDWARRLMTFHRMRRSTLSNEKIRETFYQSNKKHSFPESLHHNLKSFDEDGYLSPMEIKAKLDNISQEKRQSICKFPNNSDAHILVYSHNNSDISQTIYRCHGPITQSSAVQCTCLQQQQQQQQQQQLPSLPFPSEFQQSISIVDYIDVDVSDESSSSSKQIDEDDDPLCFLKYLFDNHKQQQQQQQQQQLQQLQNGNFLRRTPRRSTNTSSISADSGYSDIPLNTSKLIPVHLISCTLIPVNVTQTESMNLRCLTCTCPSLTSSTYFSTKNERRQPRRQRRKSLTHSQSHQTYSRQHMDIIENEINKHCSCNNKYYSTMTICPTLSLSSPSATKINGNQKDDYIYKQQEKKQLRKKRISLLKISTTNDDLTSVSRWYKPNLERDAIFQVLQTADYGAFILRNSSTHPDCYALSVKVPKFTHESNIAHYLIEKLFTNDQVLYRIKGTIKQFPTLLSLLTHHSVMPEILPITLNLNEVLPI